MTNQTDSAAVRYHSAALRVAHYNRDLAYASYGPDAPESVWAQADLVAAVQASDAELGSLMDLLDAA